MIREFLAVGGGGAFGAIARHALSGNPPAGHTLSGFPAGTFAVHAAGPFPTGILPIVLRAQTAAWLLVTGFCGGFTTFSADAVPLLRAAVKPCDSVRCAERRGLPHVRRAGHADGTTVTKLTA